MTPWLTPSKLIGAAIAYLIFMGVCISTTSYDIWGALVVLPPMTVLTWFGVNRLFSGSLRILVAPIMLGFAVKSTGALGRYMVAFDAYNGSTDAERYHQYARRAAGAFWDGAAPFSSVLPGGSGTIFVERSTSFVYTLLGSSKLAAYVVFGWIAFWGLAMFVKAACIAVPGLSRRRYAYFCMLTPSLVYWPSSIGKEALIIGSVGFTSLGMARLLVGGRSLLPVLAVVVGAALTGFVRAHLAGIWLGAFVPAAMVSLGVTMQRRSRRVRGLPTSRTAANPWMLVAVISVGLVMTFLVGRVAVETIVASDEQASIGTSITEVLRETTRRSDQGGSSFDPTSVSSPTQWPYAVARTLTRPLVVEANGMFQMLSAIEMTAYLLLLLASWRRVRTIPRRILSTPYVTLATTVLFMGGLAYSSFANLGILTRQRSLLLPFMLLLPCLPAARRAAPPQSRSLSDEVAQFEFATMERGT